MKPIAIFRLFLVQLLLCLLLGACSGGLTALLPGNASTHILFIGNSFTFINEGVDQDVKAMSNSIAVKRLAVGGYTLQDHWNGGEALDAIRGKGWDYVVLQEQSQTPVVAWAKFLEYSAKFNSEIKLAGGQTVLLMTWERPDSIVYGVTTQNLANSYFAAGNQLGAKVAPAGLAFARALQERPELQLYVEDGHPTAAGTYLAACVIYATIFEKSPAGIGYAAPGMTNEDKEFLQRIAAEVTCY